MALQRFIKQESNTLNRRIIFILIFSGLATGLLVAVANHAMDIALNQKIESRILLLYFSIFMLYIYTQKYSLTHTLYPFDDALYQLRLRLLEKIASCELSVIDKIPDNDIQAYLSREFNLAAQLLPWITYSAQAGSVLVFCLIYLAWLSMAAFLSVSITLASAALWHFFIEKDVLKEFQQIRIKEHELSIAIASLSHCAINIRNNQAYKKQLFSAFSKLSKQSKQLKVTIDKQTISSIMSIRIALFLLLAIFIFIIPLYNQNHTSDLVFKITLVTFFIMGPVSQLVYALPLLLRLNISLDTIYKFEQQLDSITGNVKEIKPEKNQIFENNFYELRFSHVNFAYKTKSQQEQVLFETINLSFQQGNIYFIRGKNNSGKTSFLKLLAGLYMPDSGSLHIDKYRLQEQDYSSYRNLFSCVFHDKEPCWISSEKDSPSPEKSHTLLTQMGLQNAVTYRNGVFYHARLSRTHQWRLSLIYAILQDKPILLIDDCATGQDDVFVKLFYEEILEELRAEGKTIVLVTQHQQFDNIADGLLEIVDGEIKVVKRLS
jgi:putative ATP-binding cassette transporter